MNYSINVQRHGHLQREINSKKKSTKKSVVFLDICAEINFGK